MASSGTKKQGVCQTQKGGCVAGLRGKSIVQCAWRQEQLQVQMGSSSQVQDLYLTFTSIVRDFEWRMRLGFIGKYAKTVFRVEGARMDRMRTLDS